MSSHAARKYFVTHLLKISLISIIAGGTFPVLIFGWHPVTFFQGAFIGFSVSSLMTMTFHFIIHRYLRKMRSLVASIIQNLLFTVIIVGSIWLAGILFKSETVTLSPKIFLILVIFSFAITFLISSIVELQRLLGSRAFSNIISGKYLHPKEEDTIFMFLDIKGSTTLAEEMGNKQFLSFLDDFFIAVTDPILKSKGEIYKYIGDEVIITWSMKNGVKNNNCVRCFFDIQHLIGTMNGKFQSGYGSIPEFRASVHCGRATVGQMGMIKSEITFLGDVVNTTSRIMGECRKYGKDLIISNDIFEKLSLKEEYMINDLGDISLRGKHKLVQLISVEEK